ncbi:hypothetical protein C6496_02075 [Candidatus Poribacteria bacterium]|nr:MAG: hypothetical protein C6496_02075 [Candidatus Poribacteria bacterium]
METLQTQNNIQNDRVRSVSRICLSLILVSLLMLGACTMPGGNQKISKIRLSIQNTLPLPRKKVPIVLTGAQLRKVNPDFTFKAYSVVTGKAPREVMVPAQADDLDYDGERDQLCFLLDLEPEETKEVSILYDPNVKATLTLDINKQTRAAILPELNAIAAMESNLITYLLKPNGAFIAYGKKRSELFSVDIMFQPELDYERPISPELRQHFEQNGITLSQQVQIEIEKPEQQWIARDLENQEVYFIRKSYSTEISELGGETEPEEQLNISESIGLSLNELLKPETSEMVALTPSEGLIGFGGIALWHKADQKMVPLPTEGDYVRILADGAIRSIVQRILPAWNIQGEARRFVSTAFVYGENPWIEHHIHIDGELPTDYAFITGIPYPNGVYDEDVTQGWVWSWGTDPSGMDTLGVALIVLAGGDSEDAGLDASQTEFSSLPVILTPNADGRLIYRTFAIWGGGIDGIETEAEFAQHVQITTTALKTPPQIKFLPSEEEE